MKLVTWNTQWCRGIDGTVNVPRIVEGARALADFDVLCLQEISQGFDRMPGAPGDQPAELRQLLPGFAIFFGAAVDEWNAAGRRQRFGNLIATRLPVARVQHHPLPWPADGAVPSMPRMCSELTVRDPLLGTLRLMTTHLEYYSRVQRSAQARALRAIHRQACAQAASPPRADEPESPFQAKPHTPHAILCGDFNFARAAPEYIAIQEPFEAEASAGSAQPAIDSIANGGWRDAWPLCHADGPQPPTFRVHEADRNHAPLACDFFFVSARLAQSVRRIEVDSATMASDHQPVMIELA